MRDVKYNKNTKCNVIVLKVHFALITHWFLFPSFQMTMTPTVGQKFHSCIKFSVHITFNLTEITWFSALNYFTRQVMEQTIHEQKNADAFQKLFYFIFLSQVHISNSRSKQLPAIKICDGTKIKCSRVW